MISLTPPDAITRRYFLVWPFGVLCFALGCAWVQFWAALPNTGVLLAVFATGMCMCLAFGYRFSHLYSRVDRANRYMGTLYVALFSLSMGVLGVGVAGYVGAQRVDNGWPSSQEGLDISAVASVKTMPNILEGGQSALFVLHQVDTAPHLVGKVLQLSWYGANDLLVPTQYYRLVFRAKQRHGGMNPHGFDYEFWLVQRGIAATGYIRSTPQPLKQNSFDFFAWVERARSFIRTKVYEVSPDIRAAQWVASLALGDQRSLNDADWQRYNATGTGHLLAVSGAHIMMLGGLIAWLAGALWSLKPQRLLFIPKPVLQTYVLIYISVAYALISGWALPAQRTVLMLCIAWWSMRYSVRVSSWHVLANAGFVALLFDPMGIVTASFWLSFLAVALLISFNSHSIPHQLEPDLATDNKATPASRIDVLKNTLTQATQHQLLLTVGLFPIGVLFFNQVSLVSPIANALAIPVIGWLSTPLALLSAVLAIVFPALAGFSMYALDAVQFLLDYVLDGLLAIPYAQLIVPTHTLGWTVLGVCASLACVVAKPLYRRICIGLIGISLVGALYKPTAPTGWKVAFLDVGQGMAVVVHSQGRTLLFDAGPRYSAQTDGGVRVIVPYLNAAGVQSIDHLVLSHADTDHTGGAKSVVSRIPVMKTWLSMSAFHPLRQDLSMPTSACVAGSTLQWAGLTLQWLHPEVNITHEGVKTNTVSCVLRITDGNHSVLLTGDIEANQEAWLLAHNKDGLQANVLLAPHHGSKTSSTPAFLNAVSAQHVVIQNGYRNRYGHPHHTVIERYSMHGLTQWRSDTDGAVIVDIDQANLNVYAWREQARRYWHTPLQQVRNKPTPADDFAPQL